MKKSNILFRRLLIEKKLAELRKAQRKLEAQREKLVKKCEHEITVTTWRMKAPDEMLISEIRPRTYCFFCQEHLGPRKYFPDDVRRKVEGSVNLDLGEYKNLCEKWAGLSSYNAQLETMYQQIKEENKDISEREAGMLMKKRLEIMDALD